MIDVRARLKASGRCIVALSDDIVFAMWRSDYDTIEGCRNYGIGIEHRGEKRWVSSDGLLLTLWQPGTQYRNGGREYYYPTQYELDRPWLILTEARGWTPVESHPMKCLAYLLSLEDMRNGGEIPFLKTR